MGIICMLNLLRTILDSIFPPRSSAAIVSTLTEPDLLKLYTPQPHAGITTLLPYQHTYVRSLISEAKFHHNERAQKLLAVVLKHHLDITQNKDTLIAIPLSKPRQRRRGYNQVVQIISHSGYSQNKNLLFRTKHTKTQTSLARAERLTNLQQAFMIKPSSEIFSQDFTLIDDVMTTGATLKSASAALRRGGINRLQIIALAH